jgi:hypothetical protein
MQSDNERTFGLFFMCQGWQQAAEELLAKTPFLTGTDRYNHDETRPVTSRSRTKSRAYSTHMLPGKYGHPLQSHLVSVFYYMHLSMLLTISCACIHISQNEETIFQLDAPFINFK